MKVIEESVIWKMEKECVANNNGCHAILEIEPVDIYLSYQHIENKDESNYSYTFKCPCCGKENMINEKDIPIDVRRAILSIEQANGTKLKYMKKLGYR